MTYLEIVLGLAVLPASVLLVMALIEHEDRKLLREVSRQDENRNRSVS